MKRRTEEADENGGMRRGRKERLAEKEEGEAHLLEGGRACGSLEVG